MNKELKDLERCIRFSAFSVVLFSITLISAVTSLLVAVFATLSKGDQDDHKDPNEWKDRYFARHPDADTDGDGRLSWVEQVEHAKKYLRK